MCQGDSQASSRMKSCKTKNRVPFSGLCFCYSSSGYPGMYVSESRGSADKPHLVFSKPSGCKPCTQSGECSGENSADGQHRQINKNTCRAKDHHGDTDLTEVMEKGTDHTDKRDVLFSRAAERAVPWPRNRTDRRTGCRRRIPSARSPCWRSGYASEVRTEHPSR